MKNIYIYCLFVLVLISSCVKDIDLDQIDDIEIFTDHNISLIHFELGVPSFLDALNTEVLVFTDTTKFPLFTGAYSRNYLIQADFEYVLSNSFDRDIIVQYELLDINDISLYNFLPILIPQGSVAIPVTQIIVESDIPVILYTDQVVVKFILRQGSTPLDLVQNYNFKLQSALILRYKVTASNG
jgi:hypothetical protein